MEHQTETDIYYRIVEYIRLAYIWKGSYPGWTYGPLSERANIRGEHFGGIPGKWVNNIWKGLREEEGLMGS